MEDPHHYDVEEFIEIKKLGERFMPTPSPNRALSNNSHRPQVDLRINLYLACKIETYEWLIDQQGNRRELISQRTEPTIVNSVHTHYDQHFTFWKKTYDTINSELGSWPLRNKKREDVTECVILDLKDMVTLVSPENNVLDVHVQVFVEQNRGFDIDERIMDRVMEIFSLLEEHVPGMVPASDTSIQALENRTILYGTDSSCPICLEEFSVGSEAMFLPCEHPFHVHCVTMWLKISHYCPICRFEMPTT